MNLPSAQAEAERLLDASGLEVPPVRVSKLRGLKVPVKISTDKLEGSGYLLNLGIHGAEIVIRAQDPVQRQRFTAAHELGHLILSDLGVDSAHGPDRDSYLERWCDRFAAELLLPTRWIERDLRSAGKRGLLRTILNGPFKYGVSHQSYRIRVSEVVPISLYELRIQPPGLALKHRYDSPRLNKYISKEALALVTRDYSRETDKDRVLETPKAQVLVSRSYRRAKEREILVAVVANRTEKSTG